MVGFAITLDEAQKGRLNTIAPLAQCQRSQRIWGPIAGIVSMALWIPIIILGCAIGGQDLLSQHHFVNLSRRTIFMICTITVCTILGVATVFSKAQCQKRRIAVRPGEIYEMGPHNLGIRNYRRAELRWVGRNSSEEIRSRRDAIVDLSSLDAEGNGRVEIYENQPGLLHGGISGLATVGALPYGAGVMIYNALRFILIPFYIANECRKDQSSRPPIERYVISDIPKEMAYSLIRIVKAPFFALAYMFAALYSFVDPIEGRMMMGRVEALWNYDDKEEAIIPANRGFSPCGLGYLSDRSRFDRGGVAAPCRAPIAYGEYKDGKPVKIEKWSFGGSGLSECSMAIEIGDKSWESAASIQKQGFAIFDPQNVFSQLEE